MAISTDFPLTAQAAVPTQRHWRSVARRALPIVLGTLLLAASLLKSWSQTRYAQPPHHPWIETPSISESAAIGEAALGLVLLAGFWPGPAWAASVATFSLFTIITAAEAIRGKASCGCFGAVQVRPIYTMLLDLAAVALLILAGRPDRGPEVEDRGLEVVGRRSGRGRWIIAGAISIAWTGTVLGIWLTRPAIALATATTTLQGQTFGNPGDLVLLEPEKWIGQRFSLANHIEIGSELTSGQWIVLLVHHDCDHCAAAVPRYVARYVAAEGSQKAEGRGQNGEESEKAEGKTQNENAGARLAVIEMPPFADAADPPPWQLPSSVLAGRLDQSRDWFATTPVALTIRDGIVISAKESDAAETPDQ